MITDITISRKVAKDAKKQSNLNDLYFSLLSCASLRLPRQHCGVKPSPLW
jgi:hypothetical protein